MAFQPRNGEYSSGPPPDKFGKPGVQYPTPNPDDLVIVEVVPLEKAQYQRLAFGTPHKDFSAAKLISQKRSNGDDNKLLVTRVYATPRVNQDAYNATITYQAKSGAHRILSRSSLILRDADPANGIPAYAPLDAFTPDSQTPSAVLVDEQAAPAESPYDTLYLRVTRIFEDFGTRAEQDAWNQQGTTFPYLSDAFPRLARRYRFPANAVPTLTIGSTTDTQVTGAVLINKQVDDESARVVVITCTFDPLPAASSVTGVGVSVAYPYGSRAYPVVTWRMRALASNYVASTDNAACPIPGYTALVLTDQSVDPDPAEPAVDIVTLVFEILPGVVIYSFDASREPRQLSAIPAEFVNGETLTTTRQVVAYGTATDPDTTTLLSSKVDAVSTLKAIKTNVSRGNIPLPTEYLPKIIHEAGDAAGAEYRIIVAVTDPATLNAAIDLAVAAIGSAFHLIEYETLPLSPKEAALRYTIVPTFPELAGAGFDSNIPDKFLTGFELATDTDWVDTTSTPATAQLITGAGVISCKVEAESEARGKRVTTRLPAGAVLPTLTTVKRTAQGQYATVVESITDGTTPLPALTGLVEDETSQVAIGGGNFLRTVTTVTDVFAEAEYTAEIPNPIPERFRVAVPTLTTASTSAGIAVAPTLGAGELRRSQRQVTEQLVRIEVETLNLSTLPTLTSVRRTAQGQYETIIESIDDGSAPLPTLSATTTTASLEPIGGGYFLRTIGTVTDVFAENSFTLEIPNPIPEEFRALAKTTTTSYRQAGVAALPTLGTGEFRRVQAQETEQIVRIEITSIDLTVLPVSLPAGSEMIDGQLATVTKTLAAGTQAYTAGYLTLNGAQVASIGAGLSILTQKTVASYPSLSGQGFDDRLGIVESFTTQKQDAATAAALLGTAGTEITPLDALRSEVKVKALGTDLASYIKAYAVTIPRLEGIPDVLESVSIEWEKGAGNGDSKEVGFASYSGTGHLDLNQPNSAQASATIIPEAVPRIVSFELANIPATDYFLFVEEDDAADLTGANGILATLATLASLGAVLPWPLFQPVSHTIVCKGEKVTVRAGATARMSISFSGSGTSAALSHGNSGDQDISSVVRATTIKPTIHGALAFTDTASSGSLPGGYVPGALPPNTALGSSAPVTGDVTVTASAASSIVPAASPLAPYCNDARAISLSAKASVSPSSLAATPGLTTIPSSGLYAYNVNVEAYKTIMDGGIVKDWCIVRVRVVDFAVLTKQAGVTRLGLIIDVDSSTVPELNTLEESRGGQVALPDGSGGDYGLGTTGSGPGSGVGAGGGGSGGGGGTGGGGGGTSPVPVITMQPASLTLDAGTTAMFSVTATGTGLTYQWSKDGAAISGATGSSYVIATVADADAGSYAVTVTNFAGSAPSTAATLSVNSGLVQPTITTQPAATVTIYVGAAFVISVAAIGGSLSYQWFKNGVAISGATTDTLTINPVSVADANPYACLVYNTVGNVPSTICNLNVLVAPPTISTQPPASVPATVGETVVVSLAATGTAPLTYQWYKGGTAISGATSAALTLPSVALGAAGPYACAVYNSAGSVASNICNLTVTDVAPVITTPPANQRVVTGAPATFSVAASGTNLVYQWSKNNVAISGANAASFTVTDTSATPIGSSGYAMASYKVTVTNGAADVSATAFLVILAASGAPTLSFTSPLSYAGTVPPTYSTPTVQIVLALSSPWTEDLTFTVTTDGHNSFTSGGVPVSPAQLVVPAGATTSGIGTVAYTYTDADFTISGETSGFIKFHASGLLGMTPVTAQVQTIVRTDDEH